MVKEYSFSKNAHYYYDIEEQCIARFPTKSNLKEKGSDNSLYFGSVDNETVCKIFLELFGVEEIKNICCINKIMKCGKEDVDVDVNINDYGQIQIKIKKDGSMNRLANNYSFLYVRKIDFTKMLLVVDFKNNKIRFKNPSELKL